MLSKLYIQRNVRLWVAMSTTSGLTPFRWAEETMRANGFTDTDGLFAIETAKPNLRIAAAVRRDEWARVPVAAASELETAG